MSLKEEKGWGVGGLNNLGCRGNIHTLIIANGESFNPSPEAK